jgi:hypothetical protein
VSGIAERSIAVSPIIEAHEPIVIDMHGRSNHLVHLGQAFEPVITTPLLNVKLWDFSKSLIKARAVVPLCRQAVALLRELKRQSGQGRHVFPGRKARPISTNALELALKSLGYQDMHCPHGFRSSASTLLNAERIVVDGNELPRFAPQAIEFQLEHVDKSTAAIYNRDQRLAERAKMMQFWADKIDKLREEQGENLLGIPSLATV